MGSLKWLVVGVLCATVAKAWDEEQPWPELPAGLTSFGAAVCDDWLYVYGGHAGAAHAYSIEDQSRKFYRLDLKVGKAWEEISAAPPIQGMAFVAHAGKLYRVGGLLVENKRGEPDRLRSTDEVACYDPAAKCWAELPALPEPRSSLDAVVAGTHLYVMGGWTLVPDQEPKWLKTAWRLDLSAPRATWEALTEPKFERRALAIGQQGGKIVCIGGMQSDGKITCEVAVYDPIAGTWADGPAMPGQGMDGFAAACFNIDGHLVASSYSGQVLQLSANGAEWESIAKLKSGRFFHRVLPHQSQALIVGGANMESGKNRQLELIHLAH